MEVVVSPWQHINHRQVCQRDGLSSRPTSAAHTISSGIIRQVVAIDSYMALLSTL